MNFLKPVVLALAVAGLSAPAAAVIVPFGGAFAFGLDPLGHDFDASNNFAPSWGIPGLGLGVETFNVGGQTTGDGFTYATSFSFVLLLGTAGVIDQTPAAGPSGFELTTRFSVNGVLWTPTYPSAQQVKFTAPNFGARIKQGDTFFVNVVFTQPIDTARFALGALWDTSTPFILVPEPATWAMLISGFGMVGFAMRRRRDGVAKVAN